MKMIRIAWIAVQELIYERIFYVLVGFALLSLGLSLLVGQMTFADQHKVTLDFMLAAAHISTALLAIFMGIGLFQRELILGSVAMVLAKPVSRSSFLLGKFLGQLLVQGLVTAFMGGLTILLCLGYESLSTLAISQTVALIFIETSVLTALAYLFAVNSGSLTTAIAMLSLFCVGHLRDAVSPNIEEGTVVSGIWTLTKNLIPNLEIFNTKNLASYGYSLTAAEFSWAVIYGLVCIIFYLSMAILTFQRKDIVT